MPNPKYEIIIGGEYPPNQLSLFNSANNVFQSLTKSPLSSSGNCVAIHGNYVYVVGGNYNESFKSIQIYDIKCNTWVCYRDVLKDGRCSSTAVICDGKLYIIGGLDPSNQGSVQVYKVEVYRVDGDKCERIDDHGVPHLRYERWGHVAVLVGSIIYIIGGGTSKGPVLHCEAIDLNTYQLHDIAPITDEAAIEITAVHYDGWIYAVGGAYYDRSSTFANSNFPSREIPGGNTTYASRLRPHRV